MVGGSGLLGWCRSEDKIVCLESKAERWVVTQERDLSPDMFFHCAACLFLCFLDRCLDLRCQC